jgi:hypothetical protein
VDTTALHDAYRGLLEAAATVAGSRTTGAPPAGEWSADQVLGHIALVDAATLAAACSIAAGVNATFDNRTSLDPWTIGRVIALAGGSTGLCERIRRQGDALCALGAGLSEAELDTAVPTLLLSAGTVLVDQPVPLRGLVAGLGEDHLPRHAAQLLALLGDDAGR